MYRQGDVLLVPINRLPQNRGDLQPRDDAGRVVLAEGEVTGHAHAISAPRADFYGDDLNRRFLAVLDEGGVDLNHEEHATIHLPKGKYRVVRQRQWIYPSDPIDRGHAVWVRD